MKGSFFLLLFFLFFDLQSQTGLMSPYSRFGLGNLNEVVHPEFVSLGGAVVSNNGLLTINHYNPASYSFIKKQRFIMNLGMSSKFLSIENIDQLNNSFDVGFTHLNFAFSINEKWACSFGILPYSQISYSFSENDSIEYGGVNYSYTGSGGLSRFYLGSSFVLDKNLSLGMNVNYMFGQLNNNKNVRFVNSEYLNVKSTEYLNVGGIYYEFGSQFKTKIDNYNISLGAILSNSNSINATLNKLSERYYLDFDTEVVIDTIDNSRLNEGSIILPTNMGLGLNINVSIVMTVPL